MAKNPQPKIVMAMACEDIMHSSTAHAIVGSVIGDPTIINFLMHKSCDIASARTMLVRKALEISEATHILFIDSDMWFPKDTIKRLLAHNKDIISVEYNKRTFPLEKVTKPLTEESKTEIYKAKIMGCGIMLINLKVFRNKENPIGEPWFNFGRDNQGRHVLGEDGWFVNTAWDAGYESWVDPTIKVGHIGEYIY